MEMGRQNLPIFLTRKAEDDKNNFWSTRLTNSTIVSSCGLQKLSQSFSFYPKIYEAHIFPGSGVVG